MQNNNKIKPTKPLLKNKIGAMFIMPDLYIYK